MSRCKQLFCCLLLPAALTGCAGFSDAPGITAPADEPESAAPVASVPQSTPPVVEPAVRGTAAEALFHALSTLDIDYRRGGHARASGFDCSGLVFYVFRTAYGMDLPRVTHEQARAGIGVARSALEPGDLVFYNTQRRPYSHVGIYIGDDRFVHAPKAGSAVRVESMRAAYWTKRYDGARRVAP